MGQESPGRRTGRYFQPNWGPLPFNMILGGPTRYNGPMNPGEITAKLKSQCHGLGFSLCGATPAVSPPGVVRLDEWLSAGYAGQMHYLADRRDAYQHPRHVLDGVRSLLMLAMDYRTAEPRAPASGEGRISRYAWGGG